MSSMCNTQYFKALLGCRFLGFFFLVFFSVSFFYFLFFNFLTIIFWVQLQVILYYKRVNITKKKTEILALISLFLFVQTKKNKMIKSLKKKKEKTKEIKKTKYFFFVSCDFLHFFYFMVSSFLYFFYVFF